MGLGVIFCFDQNSLSNKSKLTEKFCFSPFEIWKGSKLGKCLQNAVLPSIWFKAPEFRQFRHQTWLIPFLVFGSFWGRGKDLFSFKICKVRVVGEFILPTGPPGNKTWTNRSDLVAFAMSCYMYAAFGIVQCLSLSELQCTLLSIYIQKGYLKLVIQSHL